MFLEFLAINAKSPIMFFLSIDKVRNKTFELICGMFLFSIFKKKEANIQVLCHSVSINSVRNS